MSAVLHATKSAPEGDAALLPEVSRTQAKTFSTTNATCWTNGSWTTGPGFFTEDGQYLVPPLDDPKGDPAKTLFLIYDDRHRLQERARRLLNKAAHSEFPRSRTCHNVSNVRIVERDGNALTVRCNFFVTRAKGPVNDTYSGHSTYHLVNTAEGLRIRTKRCALELSFLRPQGKISIIL